MSDTRRISSRELERAQRNPFYMTALAVEHGVHVENPSGDGVERDYRALGDAWDRNPIFRWYCRRKMKSWTTYQPLHDAGGAQ